MFVYQNGPPNCPPYLYVGCKKIQLPEGITKEVAATLIKIQPSAIVAKLWEEITWRDKLGDEDKYKQFCDRIRELTFKTTTITNHDILLTIEEAMGDKLMIHFYI